MEITVKSSQVVKTGTNRNGDWELIKVTSEDGTGYTTFDKKAKYLGAGAIIDIGDPQIKEGRISFKEVVKVVKEGSSNATAPTSNGYGESPEKRASIETQCAVGRVMRAYSQWQGQEAPPVKLQELWDRALAWCNIRIPSQEELTELKKFKWGNEQPPVGTAFGDKEQTQVETGTGKVETIEGPPFESAGQFWTAATKRWGKAQSELLAILEVISAKDITDFDWAWLELEKKLEA